MNVLDHDPHFWFFLKKNNDYFIDVYCNHSFVGFNSSIQLTDSEIKEYQLAGKQFLVTFANDIQYYALTKYVSRRLSGSLEQEINNTILEFNKKI